jgi:hypothetical protein
MLTEVVYHVHGHGGSRSRLPAANLCVVYHTISYKDAHSPWSTGSIHLPAKRTVHADELILAGVMLSTPAVRLAKL